MRHGEERLITPLPLFHMNALAVSTTAMILSAGCVVQLDRFHPKTWWRDVADSGATIVHYLGVMPAILLSLPEEPLEKAHRVRFGYGANANPKDHAAFEARFGFPLIEAWAMTETGGGALVAASREPRHVGTRCIGFPPRDLKSRSKTAGELLVRAERPRPAARLLLRLPEGREQPPKRPGATAGSTPATRCAAGPTARCTSSTA